MEKWKSIEGYEGLYQVSNYGNVKSLDRYVDTKGESKRLAKGRILKKLKNKYGYFYVDLCKENKKKKHNIHRLVAVAFLNKIDRKEIVNHKDGNKNNNHFENLEWCTHQENTIHAFDTGLRKGRPQGLTEEKVRYIRDKYTPNHPEWNSYALAKRLGVRQSAIMRAVNYKTWKQVD